MMKVNKWRSTALLLLILLVLPLSRPSPLHAAETSIFTDVQATDWFYQYTHILHGQGIIQGYPDGSFRPHDPIIRKHAAKMIALAADLNMTGPSISFPDFPATDAMAPFVTALIDTGAIQGFPDGTFRPNAHIKRGHACKMIVGAFGLQQDGTAPVFLDYPPDPVVRGAIAILAGKKIVKGYPTPAGDEFRPNNNLTRAQMAKILCLTQAVSAVEVAENLQTMEAVDDALDLVQALPSSQDAALKSLLIQRLKAILTLLDTREYGDHYGPDVELINHLITAHNLSWTSWEQGDTQPPADWDTAWHGIQPPLRLTYIYASASGLSGSVDLSGLRRLQYLAATDNPDLTGLNLEGCRELTSIYCPRSGLLTLDVSGLSSLTRLTCFQNRDLHSLILDGCISLKDLHCQNGQLTSLDLRQAVNLEIFYCTGNELTALDVSKNSKLEELLCSANRLNAIVLHPTAPYKKIDVRDNKLSSLASIVNGSHLPWDADPDFTFSPQDLEP